MSTPAERASYQYGSGTAHEQCVTVHLLSLLQGFLLAGVIALVLALLSDVCPAVEPILISKVPANMGPLARCETLGSNQCPRACSLGLAVRVRPSTVALGTGPLLNNTRVHVHAFMCLRTHVLVHTYLRYSRTRAQPNSYYFDGTGAGVSVKTALKDAGIVDVDTVIGQVASGQGDVINGITANYTFRAGPTLVLERINTTVADALGAVDALLDAASYDKVSGLVVLVGQSSIGFSSGLQAMLWSLLLCWHRKRRQCCSICRRKWGLALTAPALHQLLGPTAARGCIVQLAEWANSFCAFQVFPVYTSVKGLLCCTLPDSFSSMWTAFTIGGMLAWFLILLTFFYIGKLDRLPRTDCCGCSCHTRSKYAGTVAPGPMRIIGFGGWAGHGQGGLRPITGEPSAPPQQVAIPIPHNAGWEDGHVVAELVVRAPGGMSPAKLE